MGAPIGRRSASKAQLVMCSNIRYVPVDDRGLGDNSEGKWGARYSGYRAVGVRPIRGKRCLIRHELASANVDQAAEPNRAPTP
jgi:hypothetical protein